MNSPSDPLFEKLGAYLDQELTEDQRTEVETHLSKNPESRKILEEMQSLNQLGDSVAEIMPNEAYFQDLPDRILHRIKLEEAAESRPAAAEAPAKTGFWDRLFGPAQSWRWATATAVIGAVGFGAWFVSQTGPNTPMATAPAGITRTAEVDTRTDDYVARVAETLGTYGNLGSSLDQGIPVDEVVQPNRDSILQPVSFQDLSIPNEKGGVVPTHGATLEDCFTVARYCEENGNAALARKGYRLVFESEESRDDLMLASQLGFIRTMWRDRIERNPTTAGRLYELLAAEANQGFVDHQSGDHTSCDKIWAVTATALQLGMRDLSPEMQTQLGIQVSELQRCARYLAAHRTR